MKRDDFKLLAQQGIVLDGATGTELIKRGMPAGVAPELWICENPQSIIDVHNSYIASGSQIVYAPTFGANRCKLAEFGLEARQEEIISRLCQLTVANAEAQGAYVFGDIAPTGRFIEPFGDMPFEEAVAVFREAAAIMAANGVAGFAVETMMDVQEARAALLGCREAAPELPVIVTMTFETSGTTLTGSTPEAALVTMQSLGADAFGCNCSTGPEDMAKVIAAMRPYAQIPLVAKPNAGLPQLVDGRTVFQMDSKSFGEKVELLCAAGAVIIGGCCGTTPEHISCANEVFRKISLPRPAEPVRGVISSASRHHLISTQAGFTVIGERINPTGKKALQAELREGKTDMVFDFAIQQSAAGADVLDVNMGMSGIDEKMMMRASLKRIIKSCPTPLCIDSTDPDTVEAALRLYPGRALLNSISAEKQRLEKLLPVAARYGAMLILLPLTDDGIPQSADERFAVVRSIMAECAKYGYHPEDICVDALILSVSTTPDGARTALELIRRCSAENLNTVCGLSNISFGLPARTMVNRAFLGMAMGCGLNMAIANPLFSEIMDEIAAGALLYNRPAAMKKFLETYANVPPTASLQSAAKTLSPSGAIRQDVLLGNRESICRNIDLALAAGEVPGAIINDILIPAITEVGDKYEKKEYFLPQLLAGAEAMQAAVSHLEPMLIQNSESGKPKSRLIIATVKGDIHDIGKNIVAVILRNYDFEVIDLGKDVPAELILDTAEAQGVKLVLLSALMTTTMGAMREVIELARQRGMNDLNFIVGGAVVDQLFADSIGAYYGQNPMDTMRTARKLCGME